MTNFWNLYVLDRQGVAVVARRNLAVAVAKLVQRRNLAVPKETAVQRRNLAVPKETTVQRRNLAVPKETAEVAVVVQRGNPAVRLTNRAVRARLAQGARFGLLVMMDVKKVLEWVGIGG